MKNLGVKTVRGGFWVFVDRFASKAIKFVVSLILARLLGPESFGSIAMATIFFSISRAIIEGGVIDSIIRTKTLNQEILNVGFYLNVCLSFFAYAVIFLSAPFVSDFFGKDDLTYLIRAVSVILVLNASTLAQRAVFIKKLEFKKIAMVRFPALAISGVLAIYLAAEGYGVDALLAQIVLEEILFCIGIWFMSPWRPSFSFSLSILKTHASFGSRLVGIALVNAIYSNIFSIVIAKFFSTAQLGLYNRAEGLVMLLQQNSVGIIQFIGYPSLTSVNDDEERLRRVYLRILTLTIFLIVPIFVFLAIHADAIIVVLLGDKWTGAIYILKILSVAALFYPLNSVNLNILKVKGRADLYLRVEVIKKVTLSVLVISSIPLGFNYLVLSNLAIAIIAIFLNHYFSSKVIEIPIKAQFREFIPILCSGLAAAAITGILSILIQSFDLIVQILVQFVCFGVLYFGCIHLVKRDVSIQLLDIIYKLRK